MHAEWDILSHLREILDPFLRQSTIELIKSHHDDDKNKKRTENEGISQHRGRKHSNKGAAFS